MKYLKLFESFQNIHEICKKYGIKNYTINDDGSIDVDGDVDLSSSTRLYGKRLTEIPLKFRNVGRNFSCSGNQLKSLEGCPTSVGGYFNCSFNKLTSLEWCPKSIGGYFFCSYNQLTSLEGCPKSVDGDFYCQNNQITSFEGPRHIGGGFYCVDNPIYSIWNLISPYNDKWIDMELFNDMDIIQDDIIILDRLNEFLESIGKDPVTEVEGWKCV
jgi:hypothetical protein